MDDLRNKRVTVAGLGHFGGGIAVARWLVGQGARVLVTDKAEPEKLMGAVRQLEGLAVQWRLGEHREEDFTRCDLVVASPAIERSNVFLKAAVGAGVAVTTEIRLFLERCAATVVGVTGTKGKSTTASMIHEILRRGRRAWLGGNIGRSLLSELPNIGGDDVVVLELSSFMLDYLGDVRWRPRVAVVTMIGSDHVKWHGSQEAYVRAKGNLVRFLGAGDVAILNEADATTEGLARETKGRVVRFGMNSAPAFSLRLIGGHNQVNAQAAFAAAREFGVTWAEAAGVLREFAGLAHRLEVVHEAGGVRWVNDSIATNPEAAVAALRSFAAGTVIQIVGGSDKGLALEGMCDELGRDAKAVLCIGATGERMAGMARGGADVRHCGDLAGAVAAARAIAREGDVVLLSPGCASYGEFSNFEERGARFASLARGAAERPRMNTNGHE